MICLSFTDSDRAALEADRYLHPHPKVQRKLEAIYLVSERKPPIFKKQPLGNRNPRFFGAS